MNLRELEKAATPGPWDSLMLDGVRRVDQERWDHTTDETEELIIAVRNALPLLLDVVEAAGAHLESLVWHRQNPGVAYAGMPPTEQALREALAALERA